MAQSSYDWNTIVIGDKIGVIGALEEEIVVSSLIDYIGPAVDSGVPAVYADAYAHYRAPAVYRALEGALKCCQIGTCCMYHACLVLRLSNLKALGQEEVSL